MSRKDIQVLARLARGQPRGGSHAERLQAFYAPQAAHCDAFHERLLHSRAELIDLLDPPPEARVVELGSGTGRNLDLFGPRLRDLPSFQPVDLCPALPARARLRARGLANVRVIEADATTYGPAQPADLVYFSCALTMIPDWRGALSNGRAMLRPDAILGLVDFYVAEPDPAPWLARHGALTRWFWPRWFGHDRVYPNPDHLPTLRRLLPDHRLTEGRGPVPYLPWMRVPYYVFVGRVPATATTAG
jgi:S-adenosylmethionine-diacylgycerolhomoserine-N-methlytransferase